MGERGEEVGGRDGARGRAAAEAAGGGRTSKEGGRLAPAWRRLEKRMLICRPSSCSLGAPSFGGLAAPWVNCRSRPACGPRMIQAHRPARKTAKLPAGENASDLSGGPR